MIAVDRAVPASRAAVLSERVVTLVLDGELGATELSDVGDELFRLMHHGRRQVVLDLSAVSHVDYREIRPLVARADLFRQAGGDIKIAGLTPYVRAIFRASGAHQSFEYCASADEAQLAFGRDRLAAGA